MLFFLSLKYKYFSIQFLLTSDDNTGASWPSNGKIEFQNVYLRYDELPPVLKNVNFTVYPGEKVAIPIHSIIVI